MPACITFVSTDNCRFVKSVFKDAHTRPNEKQAAYTLQNSHSDRISVSTSADESKLTFVGNSASIQQFLRHCSEAIFPYVI